MVVLSNKYLQSDIVLMYSNYLQLYRVIPTHPTTLMGCGARRWVSDLSDKSVRVTTQAKHSPLIPSPRWRLLRYTTEADY